MPGMSQFSLEGDTTGLPKTTRSAIPFEIDALDPKETWGAGNSGTAITCRVSSGLSADWVRDMVGEVSIVKPGATPLLKRYAPEPLGFGDDREQFCSICDQVAQGGNPDGEGSNFRLGNGWPLTAWARYKVAFEAFPYAVLTDSECDAIQTAAGAYAGAKELYRYVVRTRRITNKEQNTPGATIAANLGYFIIEAGPPAVGARKQVPGSFMNRPIIFGDFTLKWVRIPIGWPPPVGYAGAVTPWPPVFNPVAADPATVFRTRDSFIGSVNSTYFDCAAPDGWCAGPEQLLYLSYDDSNKYWDAAGNWVCDVVYHFKFKGGIDSTGVTGGWNHVMSAAGKWERVTADVVPGDNKRGTVDGRGLYKTNDFNDLLRYKA
jgi:hypothetical protein